MQQQADRPALYREDLEDGITPRRQAGFLVLLACAILVPLAFFAVGASSAWNATEEESILALERMTDMLHEHAVRSFETHEALLSALDQRVAGLTWEAILEQHAAIGAFARALKNSALPLSGLALIDPQNRLGPASFNRDDAPQGLLDPAYQADLLKQKGKIFVGPTMPMPSGHARGFALARPLSGSDGPTNGLVVSMFRASFFEAFYDSLRHEPGDIVSLLRRDGEVLARSRWQSDPRTARVEERITATLRSAGDLNLTMRVPGWRGRPDTIYIIRRIGDYPVYLLHGRSLAGVQMQWIMRILPYGLLWLTSTTFMLILTWRTAEASRREQKAHARLAVEGANLTAKTEANLRMTRMMDANVFGVVTCSEAGILEANDAFLKMIGLSREDFETHGFVWIGKDGIALTDEPEVNGQLREQGRCAPFETEIVLGESQTVPVLIGATVYDRDPFIWTCFVLDLTERREREAQQIFVMRELNHRTKNLLTVIRSIAGQIARTGSGWEDFRDRFNNRLVALSSAHDLLVDSNWRGASLNGLIQSQFSQFHDLAGGQIVTSGEDINLSPRAAQAIGMGLYELMTNAVKYGALSSHAGRIEVAWDTQIMAGEAMFEMHWRECGGPPVSQPGRRGFGHIVIAEMTARALCGEVAYAFEAEGVTWRLKAPLEGIEEKADTPFLDTPGSRAA